MRSFSCDVCGQLVFFENSLCLHSRTPLGFSVREFRMVTLTEQGDGRLARRAPHPVDGSGAAEVRCANFTLIGCNWLVPQDAGPLCRACALTRTRPNDSDAVGMAQWERTEADKRRLVYQLIDLGLPLGMTFDLLSSVHEPVMTGHADGVVTIDLAEMDDPHREQVRVQLEEPYRTMLGHLRHETGHHYWSVLVEGTPALDRCRELFGDDTLDYQAAIDRHYAEGAPPGWRDRYVSAYATMHPYEDWAETWAHYLHLRDTIQTAAEHGIVVEGPTATVLTAPADIASDPLATIPTDRADSIEELVGTWLPLTYALNAVNRSMGYDDLYPFVLAPGVIAKLGFVHDRVTGAAPARP